MKRPVPEGVPTVHLHIDQSFFECPKCQGGIDENRKMIWENLDHPYYTPVGPLCPHCRGKLDIVILTTPAPAESESEVARGNQEPMRITSKSGKFVNCWSSEEPGRDAVIRGLVDALKGYRRAFEDGPENCSYKQYEAVDQKAEAALALAKQYGFFGNSTS